MDKKGSKFEIWDSHSGISGDSSPVEYCCFSADEEFLKIRKSALLQYSGRSSPVCSNFLITKMEALGLSEKSVSSYQYAQHNTSENYESWK